MATALETRPARRAAARTAPEAREYMATARDGWCIVRAGHGEGGMSAHRGVLHPDEYVDTDALRAAVEAELGFTFDDVHSVYRRGRLSASTLELRALIDARLLELANTGANIAALGRVLGFSVDNSGSCSALNGALARASASRASKQRPPRL